MTHSSEYDVVVVGGGPAGATVSTLVSRRGHRVLLLEREVFPRYQIGESLLPATVHGIAALLGVADQIADAGFTVKRGGTFRWGANPEPWTFEFALSPRIAGPTSHAYQVERSRFDEILLRNAAARGVEVREGCTVLGLEDDGKQVTGVRWVDESGEERSTSARFVVDSSGNRTKWSDEGGSERIYSPFFRNLALFGYYRGGKRLPEPRSGNIVSAAFDKGWFWYIPLRPDLTSVGAVIGQESAALVQGDLGQAMESLIAECPLIADLLSEATPVTEGQYGQLRVRKDWSYNTTALFSPGLLRVGDAACFVDPVFSSGVHLATYGGLLAARSLNAVLSGEVDEPSAMAEFEIRYRREYHLFHDFLVGFYDMEQSEGSYFWRARQLTGTAADDAEAFVELVGGVSSRDFTTAADLRERLIASSQALSAAVDAATDDGTGARIDLVQGRLMEQSAALQARALVGAASGEGRACAPGGLHASGDGLSWQAEQPRPLTADSAP